MNNKYFIGLAKSSFIQKFFSGFLILIFLSSPLSVLADETIPENPEFVTSTPEVQADSPVSEIIEPVILFPVIDSSVVGTISKEQTDESKTPLLEDEVITEESELNEDTDLKEKVSEEEPMMSLLSTDPQDVPTWDKQLPSQPDNTSGALIYNYSIIVPPGRNNLNPDLQLTYSNQNNDNDIFGYGWSINIPYIQRINKLGTEKMFSTSTAFFYSSLSGELSSTTDPTSFYSKVDNGEFLRYTFSGNQWTVKDKKGTTYTFSSSASYHQDDPSDSTRIFKWMLSEIRDTNNNYIKYQYYKDGGQIYPSSIVYTGNGVTDGIFQIDFTRSMTLDNKLLSAKTGFQVRNNYRITEISTSVSGSWVKKYTLGYSTGVNGQRSILSSVTESGRDDSGTTLTLPATSFTYSSSTKGWTDELNWSMPVYFPRNTTGFYIGDVNGDGLPDVLDKRQNGFISHYSFINNGNGTWTDMGTTTWSSTWSIPGWLDAPGTGFGDFNGDALPDFYNSYQGGGTNVNIIYFNNGAGWTESSSTMPLNMDPNYTFTHVVDVNGDGLADVMRNNDYGSGATYHYMFINNGDGTWSDMGTTTWAVPIYMNYDGSGIVDLNGDGLPDLFSATSNGTPVNSVYLNTGKGWQLSSSTMPTYFTGSNTGATKGWTFADVNGDGLNDLVKNVDYGTGATYHDVYINKGDGTWTTETDWDVPVYTNYIGSGITDLDGDGLPDAYVSEGEGTPQNDIFLSKNRKTDYLIQVTSPKGGKIGFDYKASPKYRDGSDNLLNPDLPYVLQTVSAISLNDNLGNIGTTTYVYKGGLNYFSSSTNHQLAGFSQITKTDPLSNITNTYFHQGNSSDSSYGEYQDDQSKIGKIYRIEKYDNSSNLYQKNINKWDKYSTSNISNFVKLSQSVEYSYDGNSSHKDKAEGYLYSNTNGDVIQKISYGEVTGSDDGTFSDTGSDLASTTISYVASSTANMSVPSQDITQNQSLTKIKENKYYYDNLSFGNVTSGNLTKMEMWKDGSNYASTTKTYNSYGLVTQEKDPKSNATNYTYDTNNLFVATSTNPLSQTVGYVYDYSSGKVKHKFDENNRVFQNVYDGFDRVIEVKQPDLSTPASLVTKTQYTYTDNSFPTKIQETSNQSSATSTDKFTYFDGIGRKVQERLEAEGSNTYSVRDYVYGNTGNLTKESLPYFASSTSWVTATNTNSLFTNYTYDSLNRPTVIANAVGTTTNTYDDWHILVTDSRGKPKDFYKDAYENLISVVEHNNGVHATTTYTYDLNKNLTSITDGASNVRNFTYDGMNRRLTAQDLHASGDATYGSYTYVYDDASNLTQKVDPKSQTVNYTYDSLNRPLTEDYTGQAGTEVTYTYDSGTDGKGRLTTASSTGTLISNTYNALGGLKISTTTIAGLSYVTQYDYDRLGNQTQIIYPDNSQISYLYNSAGTLEQVKKKESGESLFVNTITSIDYSPVSTISQFVYGNNSTTTNTYNQNALYRLTNKTTTISGGSKAQDLSYTYDANGNITQIVDSSNTATAKTINYTYDDLNRLLIASTTNATTSPNYKHTYTYDVLGNIASGPLGVYSYLGNTGSLYANPHAVTAIATTTGSGGGGVSTSTPAYVQSKKDTSGTGVATFNSSVTTGNLVVVAVTIWNTTIPSNAITDNKGNTYTRALEVVNSGTTDHGAIFYAKNVTGGSSFAVTSSVGGSIAIHEYSGVTPYNPLDKVASTTGFSTLPSSGNVTTTLANELYFGMAWSEGHGGAWNAGYGYTLRENETNNNTAERIATEDKVITSASTTPAFFTTTSANWLAGIATFIPATTTSGGGSTSTTTLIYDNNCNLTSDGTLSYNWDYRNRLIQSGNGTATSTYSYDHDVNRVKLVEGAVTSIYPNKLYNTNGGTSTDTKNIYANNMLVSTIDSTSGSGLSGVSTSTPALITSVAAGGTPNTVTTSSVDTTGASFLIASVSYNTGATPNFSDNKGNTWTALTASSVTGLQTERLYYAKNPTVGTGHTFSNTGTSNYSSVCVQAYSGVSTSSPFDKENGATNTGTTIKPGSTTPAVDNSLVISGLGWNGSRSNYPPTIDSSFTVSTSSNFLSSNHYGCSISYIVQSTSGAVNPTWNQGSSQSNSVRIASFRPATTTSGGGSTASSTTRFIHSDHLGGTNIVTDSTATIVETLDYYPYGESRIDSKTSPYAGEKRKYAGTENDALSGLNYMMARYQNSSRGGFISQDPVFWEVGVTEDGKKVLSNPQLQNSYSYAGGNPVNSKDPEGRIAETLADIAFIANDISEIREARNNGGASGWQYAALGADIIGALLPGGTGFGLGIKAIEKSSDVSRTTEKIIDVAKTVNKNSNNSISEFGIYEIRVNGEVYKYGKADLERVTQFSGQPTRLHQQIQKLSKTYDDVTGEVIRNLGETTTENAKKFETNILQNYYNKTNQIPIGNSKSFKPLIDFK